MEEARPRFNESASMILKALETGFIEGGGPFYPQNRTAIHPAPSRSFANHFYGVAMSPNTVPIVAGLGTTMMSFLQFDIESHMPEIENYRAEFEQAHKRVAPPPVIIDVTFCDNDAGRAEEMARRYVADYYLSVLTHYEFLDDYHRSTKGYEDYAAAVDILKAAGRNNHCMITSATRPTAHRSRSSISSRNAARASVTSSGWS